MFAAIVYQKNAFEKTSPKLNTIYNDPKWPTFKEVSLGVHSFIYQNEHHPRKYAFSTEQEALEKAIKCYKNGCETHHIMLINSEKPYGLNTHFKIRCLNNEILPKFIELGHELQNSILEMLDLEIETFKKMIFQSSENKAQRALEFSRMNCAVKVYQVLTRFATKIL